MQNKYATRSGGLPPATAAPRSRWVCSLWLLLCLLAGSTAVFGQDETAMADAYTAAGLDQPTASSDKEDYLPGETAIITGSGWKLDQYVDVHFEEAPAFHGDHQHDYHNTVVKADGTWEIRYPIEQRHKGVAFTVHVIGKQSGYEATTWFTDGTITITANTNWSDLRDPDPGFTSLPPNNNDAIIVKNGATLTVNVANAICGSLKLGDPGQNAGRGTLLFTNGSVLTVSTAGSIAGGGGVILGHNTSNPGTITMTAGGTLVIGGTVTVNSGSVTPSSAGTIEFNNSSDITLTLPSLAYNNLVLSNNGKVIFAKEDARIITINGNLTVNKTGETFFLSDGAGNATFNVSGSFSMLQGTMNMANGNGVGHLSVRGNFTHTGGTISRTGNGSGTIFFNGPSIQNYTGGGNFSGAVNFWVLDGSTLYLGNNVLGSNNSGSSQSTGTFALASGATLGIGSPAGITLAGATGNVRVTGTRTYFAGANYIYNGTVAQSTGDGFPNNATANVTIDNAAGVALAGSRTVSGTLALSNGVLFTGSNVLTLGAGAQLTGAGPGRYVDGRLRRDGLSAGSVTFPIGRAGNYRPVTVNVASGTGSIEAEQFESGFGGTFPAGNGALGSRFWRVSQPSGTIANFSLTLDGTGTTPGGAVSVARFAASTTQLFPATGPAPSYTATGLTGFGDFTLSQVTAIATTTGVDNATTTYGNTSVNLVATVSPVPAAGSVEFFLKDFPAAGTNTAVGTANKGADDKFTLAYNPAALNAQGYTVIARYNGVAPHTASEGTGTLTVGARPVTITATAGQSKTYGNADPTFAYTLGAGQSLAAGDAFSGGLTRTAGQSVNTYNILLTGLSIVKTATNANATGNYAIAYNGATFAITPKALVIGITAAGKGYNGNATAAVTASIASGLESGDQVTVAAVNGQFADKNAGTNKTVTADVSITGGADAGNYTANTTASTTATISPRPLDVTATASNKEYDGLLNAQATLSDDRLAGDVLTLNYDQAEFDTKAVGTDKTVTISGIAVGGKDGGNYALANTTLTATAAITPKALNIIIAAFGKMYDGNTTAQVTVSINRGLVAGDQVTVAATNAQFPDKNVGTLKLVTANVSITGGADAGNYTANPTASASASIVQRSLNVTATAQDKAYDGNTNATVELSDNRLPGDVLTITFEGADFNSKNVGTNKTVTISGLAAGGKDGGNYALTNTTLTATAAITPRALVVTAAAESKVYDGNATAQVTLSDNRLGGDGFTVQYAAAAFNNKNAGTGKLVTVSGISLDGADAGNYQFNTTATATANITRKPVTATLSAQDKGYDGNNLADAGAFVPVVGTDSVAVAVTNARFNDKNVGTNKPVTATLAFASPDGANYQLTSTTASTTASITAKALTVNVTAEDKVYDGTDAATVNVSTVGGKVAGDDVKVGASNGTFADKNVGQNKQVTASVSKAGGDAGNYVVNIIAQTTADITAKPVTAVIFAKNKIYNGNPGASVEGVVPSADVIAGDQVPVTVSNAQFNNKHVGNDKPVTASVAISNGNYRLTSATASTTADIAPRPLTVAARADTKEYDGTDASEAAATVGALQAGDAVATAPVQRFDNKNVGTGKTLNASGLVINDGNGGNNYTVSYLPNTDGEITAKALAVNLTAQDKVYDGTAMAAVSASIASGLVAGDEVTVSASKGSFADRNAGQNKQVTAIISKSGSDAGNYVVNLTAQTTADITAKPVTASIFAKNKIYDGTDAANVAGGVPAADVIDGDVVNVTITDARFNNKHVGNDKPVTASVAISNGNYRLTSATASTTADIAPRPLTVTARADTKEYDGTNGSEAAALVGALQAGDAVATAPVQRFDNKNVGTGKTLNASGLVINDGNGGNNYTVSYLPNANGEITVKALVAVISAQDKVYDGNDVAQVSASIASGKVNGDDVTVSASNGKFADKNVGENKQVTATIGKSGDDAGNYVVNTSAQTTADITPKPLTAVITAQNKVYDGNATASATGGIPAGDAIKGDGVSVTVTNARFNNKHVGNDKPVTADVAISNDNYRLTSATASTTADITPKALTIAIAADDKVYDGNATAAVTASVASGLVAGDQVTVAATDGAFNNKNVGDDKPVTAGVRISGGNDAGNYTPNATASTTADITARTLVVSATGQNKEYDGNATATVTLSDNRVAGDVLTLSYASAAFNNKNVGTNKPVGVSGISVTGTDAGNYTANATAATTADITKRNLTVTAAGINKVYDGTTTATVTLSDNRLAGDQLTLAYGAAHFDNRNAGTGKTVTVTGITLSDADAGNYAANATAQTTADITPKAITGAFTAADKVYDGTPAATAVTRTLSGVISPDVVTLTGGTAAFNDKHVGTGKTVTLTGAGLAGTHAGNYRLASVSTTTADITKRNLTVTAAGINKVYDGTTAATVTLSDNRVAGDALTVSYASASFNSIHVGTGKPVSVTGITVTGADAGNYSANTTAQTTANITPAPIVLSVSVDPASQQYSDRVTFTARIKGGASLAPGTAGAAQTVTFSVGTQVMGTATLAADPAKPGDLVGTLSNVALLELPTANGQMAPGGKTVKAVFGTPNADYGLNNANNSETGTLTITREDAEATYTGAQSIATSSTTSSTATVTLSATLRDISAVTGNPDTNPGDIRNARIRFVRIDNGVVTPVTNTSATNGAITDGAGWTTVGLVSAADPKTGTMLIKTTVTIGSGDAAQFTYRIEVAGYYQSGEENFVVNVYKPLNDFITGGGHIIPTASTGTYASDAGRKTNFGFNVRYNKTGKNLQGNINTVFRRKESDGIVHVYQIKGNAMTSLSVNAAEATAKTAVFNGKANMTDITNPLMPVPLGGNLTLQVTMTDRGEPGINDQIGITVYNNAGGIFYSSNWSGTRTAEMPLKGGNLVVNSGSMTFGTTTATGRESAAGAQTAETSAFTVNAYPNPFADKFYLNIGSEITGDVALTVVDGKGRNVTRQVAPAAEQGAARTVEVNLSGEPHGVYFLHVQSGARREVIKVFKSNR
jgi:hypothetical protein